MVSRIAIARQAWQRLYSKRGLQYGGSGDLSTLRSLLRKDSLVLDAGCGDGKMTEAFARLSEVVGCDFSREALLKLREQRDQELDVNLVECDIVHLPFAPEKFDLVSCVHTLSHLFAEDRNRAAGRISGSVKSGGHVFVEVFGRGDVRFGEGEEVEPFSYRRGNGIVTHYFQEGEVQSLFPGLSVVSEGGSLRRVTYGAKAGRRDLIRVLLVK
ncbi:MAG: class I SAM-dependent methyltransferase [Methanobacteriota archaeon]|nr:MAG: class I SAM-dependent methyltransferase [Euryarchaeota archaeon]